MGGFRSFEYQNRKPSTASPSSFARSARPFAPVSSPSLQPLSLDAEVHPEPARRIGHSLDRIAIFPPEHDLPAHSEEGQQTNHIGQQKLPIQDAAQAPIESLAIQPGQAEKRPHLGWNFADIPLFADPA